MGIHRVTPGSHLVPAVSNGPFPRVFRDQVSKYPADLHRGMENVALRKKRTKKRRKEETRRAQTFSAHRTRCSWLLSALCTLPAGNGSPSCAGLLGIPFPGAAACQLASQGTCSIGFHYGIFFHGKIWRLQEASVPPLRSHPQHFLRSVWRGIQRPWVTEQLMWPQPEPLTQSQFEPCTHWLRESSYWSVIHSKLEAALTPQSTFLLSVVQTHLGASPFAHV